ncbi:MAG TPA: GIY-YIG nuclease family protein [Gemmatimonadaceae bacterium]|nr:GIY-YIG nuclease family protein [Gemmatimonadaceae bacterium]
MYVYIITNRSGTLYVGVTNDIARRMSEHRSGDNAGFASRYRLDRLVYVEQLDDIRSAIAREKQIKGWTRRKKIALISADNPEWADLAADWFEDS